MDNNQSTINFLNQIFEGITGFVKAAKTGEGFGFSEEVKEKFLEELQKPEVAEKMEEIEKKCKEFQQNLTKITNATDKVHE